MDETATLTRKCDNCEGTYDPETHYHTPTVAAIVVDDWSGDALNHSYTKAAGVCSVYERYRGEMSPQMRQLASWFETLYSPTHQEGIVYPSEERLAQHEMAEPEDYFRSVTKGCPACFLAPRRRSWRDTLGCLLFGHVRPVRWCNATGPRFCGRCHYNLDDNLPPTCR